MTRGTVIISSTIRSPREALRVVVVDSRTGSLCQVSVRPFLTGVVGVDEVHREVEEGVAVKATSDITMYLAGPMSGYPDMNQGEFRRVAKMVSALGYIAVVPHDIEAYPHNGDPCPVGYSEYMAQARTTEHSGACYLRACLRTMLTCDSVLFLDNWHRSVGARLEHETAVTCGIPTISLALFTRQFNDITRP